MMSTVIKPWVKALNTSQSDFESWSHEVPTGTDVTDWALANNKIRSEEYYAWAKDYYQLSFLREDFSFDDEGKLFLESIKNVGAWTPYLVPIAEWDGVVFVACTEPRTDVEWSFPVQYVLATPNLLKKSWDILNSEEQSIPENLVELNSAPPAPTPTPDEVQEEPSSIKIAPQHESVHEKNAAAQHISSEDLARLRHTANCDDFDPKPVFTDLQKQFITAQILVFDGDKQLKTLISESSWKPETDKAFESFDISKPCVFRIVQKSGHPYHGPISANEINNKFFAHWGYQKLPEHITICPIKYQEGLAGMLLCVGTSENSNSLKALSYAEQAAERFKPIIEKKAS